MKRLYKFALAGVCGGGYLLATVHRYIKDASLVKVYKMLQSGLCLVLQIRSKQVVKTHQKLPAVSALNGLRDNVAIARIQQIRESPMSFFFN